MRRKSKAFHKKVRFFSEEQEISGRLFRLQSAKKRAAGFSPEARFGVGIESEALSGMIAVAGGAVAHAADNRLRVDAHPLVIVDQSGFDGLLGEDRAVNL